MPFLGELSALLTACLWSCSALLFTSATKRVGSSYVNSARLVLAALFLVPTIAVFDLNIALSTSQLVYLSLSGVIGLTLGDTFLFKAFKDIGARISMLMMSAAPAIAALLAYGMLGETLSVLGIAGIAVTLFGIAIVVLDRSGSRHERTSVTALGLLYAFLAAIGQGVGLIFAKLAFRESPVNGFVATEVRIVAALALLLPLLIMTNRLRNPVRVFSTDTKALLLTSIGAVIGPFLGISFSLIAIEYAKVGIAATIMATVPIIMLPLVKIVYREKLSMRAIVGAFVAVAGVAMLFLQ
ncbi:MAG: DMT family transporter [Ignavibacteriae bacterium]|nr:DMT family transporter [Ignavibacteriota bacterium]